MKNRKKGIVFAFLILILANVATVHAHCPLCTGAVGVAAVSAKYFGMDSSIIGLFIGAFGISTGIWIGKKIKKEFIKYQLPIITVLSFLLTVVPLSGIGDDNLYLPLLLFGEPGSAFNKIYWMDKIVFGSIVGGIITLVGYWLHNFIKKVKGRVLFPYQGIAISLILLFAGGLSFFFIFR